MGQRIGIVGAASVGVSLLGNIVYSARSSVEDITLIDPLAPGKGPAFNVENPSMLCNTSADINSLLIDRRGDFLAYLADRGFRAHSDAFVPRALVSEYVSACYTKYLEEGARRGCNISYRQARAWYVERRENGRYVVVLDDGETVDSDGVAICTGFGRARVPDGFGAYLRHARLIPSWYPVSQLLRRVEKPGSRILVLGTQLSAIDAALVLCEQGHQVTMASRTAIVPAVRTRMTLAPVTLPSLKRISELSLDDPLVHRKLLRIVVEAVRAVDPMPLRWQRSSATDPVQRLREETEIAAAGRCQPWQDVWGQLAEELNAWMSGMPRRARDSLLDPYRYYISKYAPAMPLENARRLLHYIEAGLLWIDSYDTGRVLASPEGFEVRFRDGRQERFDYVVNAVGHDYPDFYVDGEKIYLHDPPADASPLDDLQADLRVRMNPAAPAERVWLVGMASHLNNPFSNWLRAGVIQAAMVARQLADHPGPRQSR